MPARMLLVCVAIAASALGQTAGDLAAKYPSVSAYKVRPGILMTATYAEDGQVCEMVLQRRYMPDQTDADSTIPAKQEERLIEELVPEDARGPATSKWLTNSSVGGGVMHTEKDFENVLVKIDGTYSCTEGKSGSKPDCGHGGTSVITIRWKKRACAVSDPKTGDLRLTIPSVVTKPSR